jgi:hypothetical protein
MENKRGQGLSTNTIILLILGLVILVVLILGFTLGWNKIFPFLSGNNVQTIVNNCQAACATQAKFDFCSAPRTLNDGTNKFPNVNCYELANDEDYSIYGIEPCPGIDCSVEETGE